MDCCAQRAKAFRHSRMKRAAMLTMTCLQAAYNYHAMLAARALGRLAGVLSGKPGSPRCDAAAAALSALLTPALAAKLALPDPKPLLMHLNSSLLNPQVHGHAER